MQEADFFNEVLADADEEDFFSISFEKKEIYAWLFVSLGPVNVKNLAALFDTFSQDPWPIIQLENILTAKKTNFP